MHPSTLTGKHNAERSALYHALSDHATNSFDSSTITWKLPSTDALVGTYGILLHTPHIGRAYLDFCSALSALPGLTPRTREIISLVVAAYDNCAFQIYVHGRLAQAQGLTRNELDSLRAGLYAQSFSEEDKAAYRVARELCAGSGPLPERVWRESVGVLGREGVLAAVHLTAFERYVATILRGFDAQVPAPGERVENGFA
ncbi:hypothetical protein CLAFUW4_08223 [Fulvia fulva]|uniref:Carboxymuconolactone decarboxylase-like domain-containing protein n=1 Tax=Passalora fulva TaxID=5499 RepID=A0A9Q8LDI6_PASFU|nr:uncharacterized protein CLAFUR5_08335 [Fulvia fulva]KAK4628816.1 hypothetical protein CLAFUR4_08228 [Fulvia fulva]KAK4630616.1 hypothetical protein CLAFUR0_08223 [Fulvia fulva]UJO15394.1 hypothetical protein CLAFUR5_08335 [Fulvia fulva]WPV12368.1 hypothetical protein CLAFUW4_08223 [Fulvia fulva]WPV27162.1 hypothetical protein CLAFUW7_08223 [Fulvia fulva]